MADPQSDFLVGLSPEDELACVNDQQAFGTAMVHEVDGIKRRIPPHEWMISETE